MIMRMVALDAVVAEEVPWVKVFPSPQIVTWPADPAMISPEVRDAEPDMVGLKMKSKFMS